MAKRKAKNPNQLSLKMGLNDERIPKLFGMFIIIVSIYFFVAFTSYLFTWKIDQDRVLRWSWKLLLNDGPTVDNWLGRLGAFLSNFYIYYLFGIASFGLVYFFLRMGLSFLGRNKVKSLGNLFVKVMLGVIGFSVLFEFVLGDMMQFPIGGGVGKYLVSHLTGVLGSFGVVLMLLALAGLYLVFEARIDFSGSPRQIGNEIVDHFSERVRFRGKPKPPRFEPKTTVADTAADPLLAPASAPKKKRALTLAPGDGSDFEIDGPATLSEKGIEQVPG
ncbi:MAG: DNA translocase FtsK 4TM domain-containing protein, partial [Bacteroidota bacterium]